MGINYKYRAMNNFFIKDLTFNKNTQKSYIPILNKIVKKLIKGYCLAPTPDFAIDMNTVEQRINYYHLLSSILINNIEGDIIELGCFIGQSAILFQKTMDDFHSDKCLHLYDSFEEKFTIKGSVEDELKKNFQKANLKLPIIHKGLFNETIPKELPDKISFVHIDCGFGGDPVQHKNVVLYCLKNIYTKMTRNAICVLMDYHDRNENDPGIDCNPGVKLACDDFFADKPEKMIALYGNQISHGYFRKN